jgi:hypothetical protein
VISPVLAKVYPAAQPGMAGTRMRSAGSLRDDLLVTCKTEREAKNAVTMLAVILAGLGLERLLLPVEEVVQDLNWFLGRVGDKCLAGLDGPIPAAHTEGVVRSTRILLLVQHGFAESRDSLWVVMGRRC